MRLCASFLAPQPSTSKKNEIFVDILERLTVLFNSNVRCSLTGTHRLCS